MTIAFHLFLYAHIATGAVGLLAFWIPVLARKGSRNHVRGGRLFGRCMLLTGSLAIGISACTLLAPLETHPGLDDAAIVRAVFGWMMLYLAVLTITLAWYGLLTVRNRHDHAANARWPNVALQYLLLALSVNCALQGWFTGELLVRVLTIGISLVGIAAAVTNLRFIRRASPHPIAWLLEHIKGLVGAGISVYTAFLAFGAVRLMPEAALNPVLWAIPLVVGLAMIFRFQRAVVHRYRSRRASGPVADSSSTTNTNVNAAAVFGSASIDAGPDRETGNA